MKIGGKFTLLMFGLTLLSMANPAAAAVRYLYEGPPLIELNDAPTPAGFIFNGFDGTQIISGYLDLAGPLGPNLNYFISFSAFAPTGAGPDLVGFEFTDGRNTLGTYDGSAEVWSFRLATDSNGQLTGIYLFDIQNRRDSQDPFTGTNQLGPASQGLGMILSGRIDVWAVDSVSLGECIELSVSGFCTISGADYAFSGNTPGNSGIGTWSIAPIPLPMPSLLLGSALAGLVYFRGRTSK